MFLVFGETTDIMTQFDAGTASMDVFYDAIVEVTKQAEVTGIMMDSRSPGSSAPSEGPSGRLTIYSWLVSTTRPRDKCSGSEPSFLRLCSNRYRTEKWKMEKTCTENGREKTDVCNVVAVDIVSSCYK